jgi:2-hydroxy-3-oxopropionate reductase
LPRAAFGARGKNDSTGLQPWFRIRLHQKDLNLALQAARSMGLSLPNTATAQELFNAVAAQGGSDLDHSAMVLALENWQIAPFVNSNF